MEDIIRKPTVQNWLYINLEVDGSVAHPQAKVRFGYNKDIIPEQKLYDVYIERLRLPLHTIPFLNEIVGAVIFSELLIAASPLASWDLSVSFSFQDFTKNLNTLLQTADHAIVLLTVGNGLGDANTGNLEFIVQADGRIRWTYDNYRVGGVGQNVTFAPILQDIIDTPLATQVSLAVPEIEQRFGRTSCLHRVDQLRSIELIATEIFSRSEIFQDRQTKILTDFIVSSKFQIMHEQDNDNKIAAVAFVQYENTARGDLIYEPPRLRKINLFGDGAIRTINLSAFWIDNNRNRFQIILAPRTRFHVKLAFTDAQRI